MNNTTTEKPIPHFVPQVPESGISAVTEALRQCHLSDGHEVAKLEAALSSAYGGADVVAVSSGTAALHLALRALRVSRGQRVTIPSYTCNSLYAAVSHTGARVDLADSGPTALTVTPESVRAALRPETHAIVVPHTFGYPVDIAGMKGFDLPIVEDRAHAPLPTGNNPITGRVATCSFYATKLLPAGEGGACITHDAALAATIRSLRNCDEAPPHPWAFNFKMNDLCAALALSQWDTLEDAQACRQRIAGHYDSALAPWRFSDPDASLLAQFRYLLDLPDADAFMAAAQEQGISCRRPIYCPLHRGLGGTCPRADELHQRIVSIPFYPGLSDAQVTRVTDTLRDLLDSVPPTQTAEGSDASA